MPDLASVRKEFMLAVHVCMRAAAVHGGVDFYFFSVIDGFFIAYLCSSLFPKGL